MNTGVTLLWVVFGFESCNLSTSFLVAWNLPHAPGPIAALFAIMTKVGIYSLVRVYPLTAPMLSGGKLDSTFESLW